jgi:hypothetical protein
MPLNETTKEREPLELPSMSDLAQELFNHSYALKAFGALIGNSGLSYFADIELDQYLAPTKNINAANMRWGLSQLLDLYLEKQERIVSAYTDRYNQCDYIILTDAEKGIDLCKQGMWNTYEAATEALESGILNLDGVIERSDEFRDRAKIARNEALELIRYLKGKTGVVKHGK